jgi:NitT/TauT family transport system ATP-binding protein
VTEAGPREPLITFHGVGRRFDDLLALADLDFSVAKSEFVSIVGPSGCGKSTILRLIAELAKPTSGEIHWSGRAADHRIGFVFQEPTLMPWASVAANIRLPLDLQGASPDAEAKVNDIVARVGLQGFERAVPAELSGGMKMRVSLARALITKPSLLLLDEPFAALDEITRFKLNDDLSSLWRGGGWTVVFVTHSVYEAVYLSSRVIVMTPRPGRTAADIAIDAPYPRDESFRADPIYQDYCKRLSATLRDVMTPAGAAA